VAEFLLLDGDTVRTWHSEFERTGMKGTSDFKAVATLAS
jgi:hypothetical protein